MPDQLGLYRFLARFKVFKRSYIAKVMAVAFLGTHVPLLVLLLSFILSPGMALGMTLRVLLITLLATLAGTVATLLALHHLLRPVTLTSKELQNYLRSQQLPNLPTEFADEVGTLMANTSQTLRKLDELIHYIQHYDDLTGLPNRELLRDRVAQTCLAETAPPRLVAVLLIGINDFVEVSHAWDPETASLLIRSIAQRIENTVYPNSIVARLEGDEFAIALIDIPSFENVIKLAQLLLSTLAKPFSIQGNGIHVTAGIGITLEHLSDRSGIDLLLQQAHMALHTAKQQGRSRYQFYSPEITAQLQERMLLENELYGALDRQEMRVHYQPLIDLQTGEIRAVEALVRWQHPTFGLVSPGKFIPIAEANGFIIPLGEWILRTACAQNKAWQSAGLPPIRLSVNLSARQFEQADLVDRVRETLQETQLDPVHLELEVTESALMNDMGRSINTLNDLRNLGISLALDDFGTGYSSLNYLKQFPVNMLKIDRSFIHDIISNPDSAAVTNAIIALAQNLNLGITAEGIEDEGQLTYLKTRGCHEGQGFYFSRPVPPEAIAPILTQALQPSS